MTAETYLKQHRKLSAKIRRIQETIEETRAAAEYPGINLTGMPRSASHRNTQEDKLVKLATLEEHLLDVILEDKEILYDIENTIETLDDENQKEVLFLRYIKGVPFVNYYGYNIAEKMGYSERHVYRLHRAGLNEIQKIIDARNL